VPFSFFFCGFFVGFFVAWRFPLLETKYDRVRNRAMSRLRFVVLVSSVAMHLQPRRIDKAQTEQPASPSALHVPSV
jgi:hypothetical protein